MKFFLNDKVISGILFIIVYILTYKLIILAYTVKERIRFINFKILNTITFYFFKLLSATPIAILCGLRTDNVGYDTRVVVEGYYQTGNGTYIGRKANFDFLYQFLRQITYITSDGSRFAILFVTALLTILFAEFGFSLFLKNKKNIARAVLLFCLYIGPIMMDQTRQLLCVSMTIVAIGYYFRENNKNFLIWLSTAIFVHESTLALFALPLLKRRMFSYKSFNIILIFTIAMSIIFMPYFLEIMYRVLPPAFLYLQSHSHSMSSGMGWIIDILPMVSTMFFFYGRSITNKQYSSLECLVLSIPFFRISAYYSFFIMRFYYYGAAICPVIGIIGLENMHKNEKKTWKIILLTYYLHFWIDFVILELNGTIPYSIEL